MEDGLTLFDYNVGLNDIVQLLIRSQTDPPDGPTTKDPSGVASSSAPLPDLKNENFQAPISPADLETSSCMDNKKESSHATVNDSKPETVATSTKNGFRSSSPAQDTQPPTSSRSTLINPGIGLYKVSSLPHIGKLLQCLEMKSVMFTVSSSLEQWLSRSIENSVVLRFKV